jgi:hypothetical protein
LPQVFLPSPRCQLLKSIVTSRRSRACPWTLLQNILLAALLFLSLAMCEVRCRRHRKCDLLMDLRIKLDKHRQALHSNRAVRAER